MKTIILFLMLVFSACSLRAEYNGYHMTLSIEKLDGKIEKGYAYIAAAYFEMDSLNSTDYLRRTLDQSGREEISRDSFSYFQHRIEYRYTNAYDNPGSKNSIYALTNLSTLSFSSFKKITVVDIIDFSYAISMVNVLKLSDTQWIKKNPVRSLTFGGYLHYYQLFVHENSAQVNQIIQQLETKQREIDKMELEIENDETDARRRDKMDSELHQIILKLNKFKVIVVLESSC